MSECLLTLQWRPFWSTEGSCQSHGERHTYLAAVRTLSENNVEALPAGRERSQPLKEKDRRKKRSLHQIITLDLMCQCQVIKTLVSMYTHYCTLKRYIQDYLTRWSIVRAFYVELQNVLLTLSRLWKEMSLCLVSLNTEYINRVIPAQADRAHFLCCEAAPVHLNNPSLYLWVPSRKPCVCCAQPQITLHCHYQS